MTPLAWIESAGSEEVPVATLHGEVDASNVAEIGVAMDALLTNRVRAFVVDLTATTYLDSAGINLLFAVEERLRGRQQRLLLTVPPSSRIVRVLSITALDQAVETRPTLPETISAAQ